MDSPRVSPAVAKSGDKIWIVGGYTKIPGNPMLSSTILYDLNRNRQVFLAAIRNLGQRKRKSLPKLLTNWILCRFFSGPALPFPRCNGSLIAYYDQLILLGGASFAGQGEIKSLSDVSHLVNGEWVTAGNLKTGPRHGHCALRIGKYVLLVGGVNSETMAPMDQVESFNVEKFRGSTKVAHLPLKLSGPSGVVVH